MKCNNCTVPVPPAFTKALVDNECPACGKEIMGATLFKEFESVRAMLMDADSDVDEATLVKVAALISGKYELVPRGAGGVRRFTHKGVQRSEPIDEEEFEEGLASLSPEEQAKIIALRKAEHEKTVQEWGLNHGGLGAVGSEGASNPALEVLVEECNPPDLSGLENNEGKIDPFEADRMARLERLRSNPSYQQHVQRSDI